MKPRKHQLANIEIATRIASDRDRYRRVINLVTPGGGKSALPPIYASALIPHKADKLCWVVPRDLLRRQAEQAFLVDWPWVEHKRRIRAAANEQDPSRGTHGYVTTYQAINQSPDVHRDEFDRYRYVLVLDEPHHVEQSTSWHRALMPLVDRAVLVVLMSGTFERGNGGRIAFVDYHDERPVLEPTAECAVVPYTRADALAEDDPAIVPITFTHLDLAGEWVDRNGDRVSIESFDNVARNDSGDAIHTGLATTFARDLLDRCTRDWLAYRAYRPNAQMLVVAHLQERARAYDKALRERGIRSVLAITDEGDAAQTAIQSFRQRERDVLVTVGMAYEGLDAPGITHIACLTHVRSRPWIEQMLGRGVRVDPDTGLWASKETCFAYVPDDPLMRDVIERIRDEQAPYVRSEGNPSTGGGGDPWGRIVPLNGAVVGVRSSELDGDALDRETTARYEQAAAAIGVAGRITPIEIDRLQRALAHTPRGVTMPPRELTVSEIEDRLRTDIQNACNQIDRRRGQSFGTTNDELFAHFRKSRRRMTNDELQAVLALVNSRYGEWL